MEHNPDKDQCNGGSRKAHKKEKKGWKSSPTALCMAEEEGKET
jgi:hypothetical protein